MVHIRLHAPHVTKPYAQNMSSGVNKCLRMKQVREMAWVSPCALTLAALQLVSYFYCPVTV